ncbi:MipA/OmpV family protein [Sphingomonas jeddahensis]|uniref:MltA-interacting protein MipA n=1 Tax=Sphingomonas jeddahensis TaxID=1915074 RepID=A0A1V2EV53_9SPHN|nr:MipA/OmpV family protein [Sphingomonas jeddahensis]ONF96178.1 MltA-interacting protein MipA [Sphingomonas jeddahensis]
MATSLSGRTAAFLVLGSAWATGAAAQDEPRRTRVAAGPQFVPRYPGAKGVVVRPFLDFSRARGNEPFRFEAADESAGLPLLNASGFSFGPAIGFEGARRTRDVRGVPSVGFTVEAGGFAQYQFAAPVRARVELRQGIGGHKGLIGMAALDYVARDRDEWLFSIGPRVTYSNGKYQRAYFGVPVESVATSGLPAFRPSGGVQAVGANAGYLMQFTPRWGVYAYGKYDRLVDDAADSPVVRRYGARDQWSGGLSLTYTFGVRD